MLSARSRAALEGQARRLRAWVRADEAIRPVDVARSLATTRVRFDHRAVVVGADRERLLAGLDALIAGRDDAPVALGAAEFGARAAFVFSGQGSQRPGMGRELHRAFPVFAAAFNEACDALDEHLERPLREVMWAEPDSPEAAALHRDRLHPAALFAYQVAAFRLLAGLGVEPDVVAGHSVGEIAAAHVAGVWDLADAARFIAARGWLMQALAERGRHGRALGHPGGGAAAAAGPGRHRGGQRPGRRRDLRRGRGLPRRSPRSSRSGAGESAG